MVSSAAPVCAQTTVPPPPKVELWTGAEAFGTVWALYAGGTYSPFGSIAEDGLRLRAVAGYGQYSYRSKRWTGSRELDFEFHGTSSFSDILAGYQKTFGSLTVKAFAGATLSDRMSDDPEADWNTRTGAKAVLETWWNVTDQLWTSVDLSWATLDTPYAARARLGWRAMPQLSLGLEGGAIGDWEYQARRAGAFVRYEWAGGEASLSAGLADDTGDSSIGLPNAYVTANVLTRF